MGKYPRLCDYGNCDKQIDSGEGVTVTYAGYRKRFCSPDHAAQHLIEYESMMKRNQQAFEEMERRRKEQVCD